MESHTMHYDTLVRVTGAISESKDPEEVALMTAESVKTAFNAKGCSIFMVNRETDELELAAGAGPFFNAFKPPEGRRHYSILFSQIWTTRIIQEKWQNPYPLLFFPLFVFIHGVVVILRDWDQVRRRRNAGHHQ